MEQVMTWFVPILVALITGSFSYLGVARTVRASNDKMQTEQAKQILIISQQIDTIKDDVKRLEQQVADLEKQMK